MPTAAKCVEDNSTTAPFLFVSTEDKVAKAEKPFKVSNSRKFLREFVVWSVVAIDIVLFEYIQKRIEVVLRFVNKYRLLWSSQTY